MRRRHEMPFGAEVRSDGSVRFRLWAPAARRVELSLEEPGNEMLLTMRGPDDGWFELTSDRARPGSLYRYYIDGELFVPDPATRHQPEDVHGPSQVVDPAAYEWHDADWRGRPWEETVFYELHVGSFTRAGNFRAIIPKLDALAQLGVSALELMPVADFPGARNWGYDGVLPFAPDSRYGSPEDLKALVDAAHARGLMVFLDVVYNHFGPEGNYLYRYAPAFSTERHHTPWGAAINYDGPGCRVVRDFFIHNALYWLEEYHMDGLRLDAVHAIFDDSRPDILEELAEAVRAGPGRTRHVHLVLENDHNAARYLARSGGRPRWYDAQWNDDLHHALHVLATGENEGYYQDYADAPLRHLGRCLTEGFAWQGEPSPYRHGARRGEPSRDLPPTAFVGFLQNHDQVGNRAFGERITAIAPREAVRAATEILLLAPAVPLLFMGQEWGASQPFPFFCDFGPELAARVAEGRRREFAHFSAFRDPAARARIPDPCDPQTFESARLRWEEREQPGHREWLDLHRRLLALRAREIVPRLRGLGRNEAEYRLLGERALSVCWRLAGSARLFLLANLGAAPLEQGAATPAAGRLLYATDSAMTASLAQGILPPWSVAWFLDEGRA